MNKLYCDEKYLKYMQWLNEYNTCNQDCEKCTTKKFWQEVLDRADQHIIILNKDGYYDVYSVYPVGEGGFYNTKFRIKYKNGSTKECGLWYRGVCPSVVSNAGKLPEVTERKNVGYAGEDNK